MAKIQRYNEELMLDAVAQYSQLSREKIMMSKLARWASENIEGLEGITEKDFSRKITVVDKASGKKTKVYKPSMMRIREINASRTLAETMRRNELLKSSSLDTFFMLPRHRQRQLIVDTRAQFDELTKKSAGLTKKNWLLLEENKHLREDSEKLKLRQEQILKKQAEMEKKIALAVRSADEEMRRAVLASIGVSDDGFSLKQYRESLSLEQEASINEALPDTADTGDGLLDSLFEGLDI